jgi:hypothetical protein
LAHIFTEHRRSIFPDARQTRGAVNLPHKKICGKLKKTWDEVVNPKWIHEEEDV